MGMTSQHHLHCLFARHDQIDTMSTHSEGICIAYRRSALQPCARIVIDLNSTSGTTDYDDEGFRPDIHAICRDSSWINVIQ